MRELQKRLPLSIQSLNLNCQTFNFLYGLLFNSVIHNEMCPIFSQSQSTCLTRLTVTNNSITSSLHLNFLHFFMAIDKQLNYNRKDKECEVVMEMEKMATCDFSRLNQLEIE